MILQHWNLSKPGCLLPRASPWPCSWIAKWKAEWRSRRASVFLRSRRHEFRLRARHAPCSLWHQTKPLSPGINSYDSHLAVYCRAIAFRSLFSIRASQQSAALALVTLKTSKHLEKLPQYRKDESEYVFFLKKVFTIAINVKPTGKKKENHSMVLMHWGSLMYYVVKIKAGACASRCEEIDFQHAPSSPMAKTTRQREALRCHLLIEANCSCMSKSIHIQPDNTSNSTR